MPLSMRRAVCFCSFADTRYSALKTARIPNMRILALDIGKVRTGVAVSDPQGRVASPVCVVPSNQVAASSPAFKRLLDDWQPDALLAGLPYSLSGEQGSQARRVRKTAEQVAQSCGLPLYFCDERLSSSQAKRSLREKGLSEKDMRGKVDMIAASLFLQAWLDSELSEAAKENASGK